MKKILVIEDEDVLRLEISNILKFEGFEVIEADNGLDGYDNALKHMPDLILCDIMMPGLNGHELLARLHRMDETSRIPFIFMSALSERKDLRTGMEMGADDYITKPFTIKEVLQAIRTRLGRKEVMAEFLQREIEKARLEIREQLELLGAGKKKGRPEAKPAGLSADTAGGAEEDEAIIEAFRRIDSNNTLKNLEKMVDQELQKQDLSTKSEQLLISMKNQVRKHNHVIDNWMIFQEKFNLKYPGFTRQLIDSFPGLSQHDITLASAISINLKTNQLAGMLNITQASVRTCRYRLKKKMGLRKSDRLLPFLNKLKN